jgi:hypothetical protein
MAARKQKRGIEQKQAVLAPFKPENYPVIYANNVQVIMSQFDFRMDFGELQPPSEPNVQPILQKVGILMSPKVAKALGDMLLYFYEEYEQKIADLPIWTRPQSK